MTPDERIDTIARALYEYFCPIWREKDGFDAKSWDEPEAGDEPNREMWRGAARAAARAVVDAL